MNILIYDTEMVHYIELKLHQIDYGATQQSKVVNLHIELPNTL